MNGFISVITVSYTHLDVYKRQAYIWYEAPEEEQNFAMLIDMIDASEAREEMCIRDRL